MIRDFMDITKALSDENRVRALIALKDRELCVCQIVELLGLAPSTVSKHMFILKQARLIEGRKEGRWIYYRRANPADSRLIAETFTWLDTSLAEEAAVKADLEQLMAILQIEPEELCKRQAKCG